DRPVELRALRIEARPVADHHPGVQMHALEVFLPRIERERPRIARAGLVVAFEIEQHAPAIDESLGMVGSPRDRGVAARQRLIEPLEAIERGGAAVVGGGIRLDRNGEIEVTDCLGAIPALVMNQPQQMAAVELTWIDRENLSIEVLGLRQAPRL